MFSLAFTSLVASWDLLQLHVQVACASQNPAEKAKPEMWTLPLQSCVEPQADVNGRQKALQLLRAFCFRLFRQVAASGPVAPVPKLVSSPLQVVASANGTRPRRARDRPARLPKAATLKNRRRLIPPVATGSSALSSPAGYWS